MAFGKTLGALKVLLMGDSTNLEKTLKGARKGVDTFKGYALKAAGAIGVAFSFTAAIQGLNKFYNKLDEVGKRSSALGVTAEYYQKMQYAAERTGSSLDQVYEAMFKVKKFAGDALSGSAEAQKTFAALGLDPAELEKLRADELFDLVNKRLAEMPSALERNAYGAKLMGESYGKMSNYLRDYISLGEEAQQKGFIVDAEQVKEVEAMKDAFTDVGKSIEVAVAKLVSLTGMTGKLLAYSEGLTAMAGGTEEAETKAGMLKYEEVKKRGEERIAASPEIQKDLAAYTAKLKKKGYTAESARSRFIFEELYSTVEGTRGKGTYGTRYLERTHASELAAKREEARLQYEHQKIEEQGLAEEALTRELERMEQERLAAEHRRIEEEGQRQEAGEKELNRIAAEQEKAAADAAARALAEQAKAKSAAVIASFSAPNRAGVALDGSIAAYKAQFNNDNNYRKWMQENAKKAVDLQAQIAANTAGLQNAVPAVIGINVGG